MKNNPVTTVLLGALIVLAILTVYLLVGFNRAFGELRVLQPKVAAFQNDRIIVQALAADLNEYGKTHPAIDPVLQSLGMKATNLPAGAAVKPPTR